MQNAKKIHMQTPFFVLRNVFPVEWGIFAFSSIIIITNNSQNAFGSQMCFGEGTIAGHVVSPPFSSRGVLKWHSLLKVHLAIDESTSARVQLKWENALLARFWTLRAHVTPSKENKGNLLHLLSQPDWLVYRV